MSLLERYLSLEDYHESVTSNDVSPDELPVPEVEVPEVRDVTEDELEEAEELLEDLNTSEVEQERAVEEVERFNEEVGVAVESFDRMLAVFRFGLENHQFSPQLAAFADQAIKQYGEVLGAQEVPSFEDYSSDDLEVYYGKVVAALEDYVSDTTNRQSGVVSRKLSEFVGKLVDNSRVKKFQAVVTQCDVMISELNALPSGSVEVKLSGGMRKALSMGGDIPSNLVDGVKKERATMNWVFGTYLKSAVSYHTAIFNTIEESRKISSVDELKKLIHQKIPAKTPEAAMGDTILKGTGLFGNVKYKVRTDSDPRVDVLDPTGAVLAHLPVREKVEVKGGEKAVKVDKGMLVKLLQEVKSNAIFMAEQTKKTGKELNTVIVNSRPEVQRGGNVGWFFLAARQRARLLNWAHTYAWVFIPFVNEMAIRSLSSQKSLVKFAKKGVTQLKKQES
jgi:hypothetical protein